MFAMEANKNLFSQQSISENRQQRLNSSLRLAISNGDEEALVSLIEEGADVNYIDRFGYNSLHYAVFNGFFEIIDILIKEGVDSEKIGTFEGHKYRPIHMVVLATNKKKCLEQLIKCNVPIDSTDEEKNSLLHLFTKLSPWDIDIIKTLIAYGLDPNAVNESGYNCLHLLASSRTNEDRRILQLAKLFLEHGTEINVQNNTEKETPLHIATRYKKYILVNFLLAHGADIHLTESTGRNVFDHLISTESSPGPLIRVYMKHIVLRKHREEIIERSIIETVNRNFVLQAHNAYFEDIMSYLKVFKVTQEHSVTYYDILCRGKNTVAKYLKKRQIREDFGAQALRTLDYGGEITFKFNEAMNLLKSQELAFTTVNEIFGCKLPYLCVEKIAEYIIY